MSAEPWSANWGEITSSWLSPADTPDWKIKGACRRVDPNWFFPERGQSVEPAKTVCRGCCVRDLCLEFALSETKDPPGIWAGTSSRERRVLRRERKRRAA